MKPFLFSVIALGFLCLTFPALAQTVDVKGVDGNSETTTIEIHKGGKPAEKKTGMQIVDGSVEIEGDEAPTRTQAKKKWKMACKDWEQGFRKDNSKNQIISITCGKKSCSGSVPRYSCSSKALYKIKTKID